MDCQYRYSDKRWLCWIVSTLQVEYELFDMGPSKSDDYERRYMEGGIEAAQKIITRGPERANVMIGNDAEYALTAAQSILGRSFGTVQIALSGGLVVGNPTLKLVYPFFIGSVVSGTKVLGLFPVLLAQWGWKRIMFANPDGGVTGPLLISTLKAGGVECIQEIYPKYSKGQALDALTDSVMPKMRLLRKTGFRALGSVCYCH